MSQTLSPPPDTDREPIRLACFLRQAVGASDRQAAVRERIEALAADGHITDHHLEHWPERLTLDSEGTSTDPDLAETVDDLTAWADAPDRDLGPAWRLTHDEATLLRPATTTLRPPTVSVACYREDELVALAPSVLEGRELTVEALLSALAADRLEEPPGPEPIAP